MAVCTPSNSIQTTFYLLSVVKNLNPKINTEQPITKRRVHFSEPHLTVNYLFV